MPRDMPFIHRPSDKTTCVKLHHCIKCDKFGDQVSVTQPSPGRAAGRGRAMLKACFWQENTRYKCRPCDYKQSASRTHSVPWRLSVASPSTASTEYAGTEFLFLPEFEILRRLVAPVSRLGWSSSSLLVSFNQAGTVLVDLSLNTRPELCGLGAAPLTSAKDAETPALSRLCVRSLSPILDVTVLLVPGVCSAALSSAGCSPWFTFPFRSPTDSITSITLSLASTSAQSQSGLLENNRKTVRSWFKDVLIASGLYPSVAHFLCAPWSSQINCSYLFIINQKLFTIIHIILNWYNFKEADTI